MVVAKHIEVVRTHIKGLSSLSQVSATAIVGSLSKRYSDVRLTAINTADDLDALIERMPDVVFLGMTNIIDRKASAQKIWMSSQLEAVGIPHTGSNRQAHQLDGNKDWAKRRILSRGLATARYCIATPHPPYVSQDMLDEFPLFVKPTFGGGGSGIDKHSVVRNNEQLHSKITSLRAESFENILVERYLDGREFSVAIIKDRVSGELTAMPLELIPPETSSGERILSLEVKSLNQEKVIAVDDPREHAMLSEFALDVFRALGARDYGRIDIRLDSEGNPHFLEANLIPSLISGYGSFPKAYQLNRGVGYDQMLDNIVSLALSRRPFTAQAVSSSTL